MRLIDILTAPWAIAPEKLREIQEIYVRHMRGDKIDINALAASTGLTFDNQHKGYEVQDGVALLAVDGVIAKRMNLFSKISGGVSSELLGRDFIAALEDKAVQAIVLAIDSPGGTVDGTPELAELIFRARGRKPVIAHTDGMMASAAYWIGSAADRIMISSEVTSVGSIGVVAQHVDISEAEARRGIHTTEVYAGKYKRIASQYRPLSEEGRATIQEMVDHVYAVFVDAVADHRGVEPGVVLERMADGRVFHGSQATLAGLVDGVATLAEAMDEARAAARITTTRRLAGVAAGSHAMETIMDITTLKEEHPDLVAQIEGDVLATLPTDEDRAEELAQARAEGAASERARIAEVRAQLIPGHEDLVERLAFDGKSTGADAALAIVEAEKTLRTKAQDDIDLEAPPLVEPSLAMTGRKEMKRGEFMKLSDAERRQVLADGVRIVD